MRRPATIDAATPRRPPATAAAPSSRIKSVASPSESAATVSPVAGHCSDRRRSRGTRFGLEKTEHIHRILLHPNEPDTAFVAAFGTTRGENEERGVFKTRDAGKTWLSAMAMIVAVYVLTPHGFVFHMKSSVTRLLSHQLLLVACLLRLGALVRPLRPPAEPQPAVQAPAA